MLPWNAEWNAESSPSLALFKFKQDQVRRDIVLGGRLRRVALNVLTAHVIVWFYEEKGNSQTHALLHQDFRFPRIGPGSTESQQSETSHELTFLR